MNAVLKDIMREDLIAAKQDGAEEERNATAESMINDGLPGEMITKYSRLGRHDIVVIAKRMNRIVSWGDSRE